MKATIHCPDQNLGDVIGDLSRRRGMIIEQTSRDDQRIIEANVPLARLFGYIGDLRTLTSGRGDFTMVLDHYGLAS